MELVNYEYKCLAITGDFGTGKTFLLTHKAQNCASEGVKTYIICCPELNKYLKFNPKFTELPLVNYLKECIRDLSMEKAEVVSVTELCNKPDPIQENVLSMTGDMFIKKIDSF